MKKTILAAVFILCGCVGAHTQAVNGQFQTQFKAEQAAWESVGKAFPLECSKGDQQFPPAKSKVVAYTKCYTKLTNEKVMPVAAYPDLVIDMRTQALRNAGLYADGKISATEWEARGNENFSAYLKAADSRYASAMNGAMQRDQIAAQQTQQALHNMAIVDALQSQPAASTLPSGASCRFNPATGRNQQCFHVLADGSCAHFGSGC